MSLLLNKQFVAKGGDYLVGFQSKTYLCLLFYLYFTFMLW